MTTVTENAEILKKFFDLLEQHLGPQCEIVLHDLTNDYEHTIVDIRNGHVTGRKVGGCGSNLGLEVLRGTAINGDRYNYITHTLDGKILRSSSVYFRNADRVVGSICLNSDITDSVRCENYLHSQNNYELRIGEKQEFFATDVKGLLEHLLLEGERIVGKSADKMDRADRCRFLEYLDENGAFLISKSSERVCKFLGVSKYTLYTMLEKLRGGAPSGEEATS